MLDQIPQDIERLRLKRHGGARPRHGHPPQIDLNVAEFVDWQLRHSFLIPLG
jgi:hypothetical protein